MAQVKLKIRYKWLLLLGLSFQLLAFGGVTVNPKHLVFDSSRKTVALTVRNTASGDYEAWVEVKFGYSVSDDSGKAGIVYDSLAVGEYSAAEWIKPYPQRFLLPPGESQTIRLVAYPPLELKEGEYWARVNLTFKPRKATINPKSTVNVSGGITFIQSIGIPAYFRQGKVTTGVQLTNLEATASKKEVVCTMNLERLGTGAYLGVRTFRLMNNKGEQVANSISNVSIFKKNLVRYVFDRAAIPAGQYTLEVEVVSGKRTDIDRKLALSAPAVRSSVSVVLP